MLQRQHRFYFCVKVILISIFFVFVPLDQSVAEGSKSGTALKFSVLSSIPLNAGINDVCCNGENSFYEDKTVRSFSTGYGLQAHWLKVQVPAFAGVIHLSPILDDVTLYTQSKDGTSWKKLRTGDMVANDEKIFSSPFMALPLSDDLSSQIIYVRIAQSTMVKVGVKFWQLPEFLAMQATDHTRKTYLLGFVSAIILYNIFVSVLVRDLAFLANALCISSLLALSLYLSGYGVMYVWAKWADWSNTIQIIAIFFGIAFGAIFTCLFLRTANEKILNCWPLFVAPAGAVLACFSAIFLPYWVIQLWMLINVAILLIVIWWQTIRQTLDGDSKARIFIIPMAFAISPGIIFLILQKVYGIKFTFFGDNLLEVTLCLEAILFSLALASRIRLAENDSLQYAGELELLQKGISQKLLETIDSERRRVASDLHDTAGQGLLAISSRLSQLLRREKLADSQEKEIRKAANYSRDMVGEIRRISHDLHPATIDYLGWQNAIEELFNMLCETTDIEVKLKMELSEQVLDDAQKLHLYRITQEAVSNIAKHSGAKHCEAHFYYDGGNAHAEISDDGQITSDQNSATKAPSSIGHLIVDQRIATLGGVWSVETENNKTIIRFSFPVYAESVQEA